MIHARILSTRTSSTEGYPGAWWHAALTCDTAGCQARVEQVAELSHQTGARERLRALASVQGWAGDLCPRCAAAPRPRPAIATPAGVAR